LKYSKLSGETKVLDISDAAFRREDATGLSMRGALVCLAECRDGNPGGRVQMIDWYSRRQRRVVRSTFGAELNALADSLEVSKLLAFAVAEIRCPEATLSMLRGMEESGTFPVGIEACIDCKSIFDALFRGMMRGCSQRLNDWWERSRRTGFASDWVPPFGSPVVSEPTGPPPT